MVKKEKLLVIEDDMHIWKHVEPVDCGQRVGSVGQPAECPNVDCSDPHGGVWEIVA